jgi:predicted ATPase/class 3 adenylate cyclase
MGEPPSGTVTFLFTDIEGSTRLLTRLRDRYVDVLAEHQRLLRAAFEEHDGHEVHTEGDAFFVAFARARDAIAAAVTAQRALASQRWPDGVDVRVRMGLHTGEAALRLGDYVGLDVHRAARICAAGHGGQVLLSRSTRELVADELPPGVALRDLGEHLLKDLDRAEQLFQLVASDLRAEFPPPGSVSAISRGAAGLPPLPNRTIGREGEVRAIADHLRADSVRLLTLTGPGGVGKTRLAIEAARRVEADFADGAHFVSLAPLRGPADVPAAIVEAVGIVLLAGESADRAVERVLAAKHLLLVVDNVEHLLGAAPFIALLPAACPGLTVLATSRERLALQAEVRYLVSPLPLPPPEARHESEALPGGGAVELFCERARAQTPGLRLDDTNARAVAEVCRRVDGLPLAIELAAARCALLSPSEIAERLNDALGTLGAGPRDAPARQHTLRATIDWSHDLLSDTERRCFARFAVFAGGATVLAAEAITGADLATLDRLAAKSLLERRQAARAPTRLLMLETIRSYASERLASSSDRNGVGERHCRYYLALAQRHGVERALWGQDRNQHLAALDADAYNLDAALRWGTSRSNPDLALALVIALKDYWLLRNRYANAVAWIDTALSIPRADAHPGLLARALLAKDHFVWALGRGEERAAIVADAAALARKVGDPALISRALQSLAHLQSRAMRLEAASSLAEEAIEWATRAGDTWEIAMARCEHALAAPTMADIRARVEPAASLLDEVGNVFQLGALLVSAAYTAICEGGARDARTFLERAEAIADALDDSYMLMMVRGNSGLAALFTGELDAARNAFREELQLCREMVILPAAHEALRGLAAVAIVEGDIPHAARLIGAATAHRYGDPQDPVDARLKSTFFDDARTQSGGAWDAAIAEGAAMSLEDAIVHALGEPRAQSRPLR